jgi:hypothetical protein
VEKCQEVAAPLLPGQRVEMSPAEMLGAPLYVGELERPILEPMGLRKQEVLFPHELVSFSYYYLLFPKHPNQGFPVLGIKDCIAYHFDLHL